MPLLALAASKVNPHWFFVKMQCCMPLCENTSENFSTCGRITFHGFPSEPSLCAAWLRATGIQDSQLPDSAVVCSQHFLHDDVCETESGSRQLRTGAVPSTVLVCMTCLDTDSKMSPISQYNLEGSYKELTGHPLWDRGNLKQTLCVQCAQQLRNFSRFREQSLRARSLMMELLETHEVITIQHIKMIQHANNTLRNNLVSATLRPDPCDMNIEQENSDEDRQTGSEYTLCSIAIKTEGSEVTQWEDVDMQTMIVENADCVKEDFTIDQFTHDNVCTQLHDAGPHEASPHTVETPSSASLVTNIGNKARATEATDTKQHSERALMTNSGATDNGAPNTDLMSCVVKLYDILKYPQNAKIKVESLSQTLRAVNSHDNAHTACEDVRVADTHNKPAASVLSETEPATSGHSSHTRTFTCNVCERAFTRKDILIKHMKSHSGEKPYACETCSNKFAYKSTLVTHMRKHTGEKPYTCEICSYKSTDISTLVKHMRTHTGKKPYSCKICSYKFACKSHLERHMRTHTGEKPYACNICSYKFACESHLVRHVRTHTGEKPYSCGICSYKFADNSNLVTHMRIHTGEKPYSCNICSYKCRVNSSLVKHFRIHTGEKPYSCNICSYKCRANSSLVKHVRIHTGEKPYSCMICNYKCSVSCSLVKHMRIHTGAH